MKQLANAHPRKRFFLEMFTRDLSLEDCVLDLIDNSVDALHRTRHLDLSPPLLAELEIPKQAAKAKLPSIEVVYTDLEFRITDNCGGIEREDALNEVFSFGHSAGFKGGQLGVYGIGLKRALFKIGKHFRVESKTTGGGFVAELDVDTWAKADEKPEDWTIPLEFIPGVNADAAAGTSIFITRLTDEVKMRIKDKTLEAALHTAIGTTYAVFMDRCVRIRVNGKDVRPMEIPVGESAAVTPGHKNISFENGKVEIKLIATLAARIRGEWSSERAGWYVLCNNRVVLAADKSELTGWNSGMPKFHSKYNGFIGLAFFQSESPGLLPWTTTKRGVNGDSVVFREARVQMLLVARGIISFLNEMYPSDLYEQPQQREIADAIAPSEIRSFATKPSSDFTFARRVSALKPTVRVQFDAKRSDVERIRRHLRKSAWGASRIAESTFNYFLENECPK
ncbi:MAG: ATP-binding protein [Bryobacterales bacterium]|nr:ATP-binding protein [Bryobacterales bacterium]